MGPKFYAVSLQKWVMSQFRTFWNFMFLFFFFTIWVFWAFYAVLSRIIFVVIYALCRVKYFWLKPCLCKRKLSFYMSALQSSTPLFIPGWCSPLQAAAPCSNSTRNHQSPLSNCPLSQSGWNQTDLSFWKLSVSILVNRILESLHHAFVLNRPHILALTKNNNIFYWFRKAGIIVKNVREFLGS